jgi:Fe2+ transport system protein FeoA
VIRPDDPSSDCICSLRGDKPPRLTLAKAAPGVEVRVRQIYGSGKTRQQLLDLGLLPGVPLTVLQRTTEGFTIRLEGFELRVSNEQAARVGIEDEGSSS